MKRIIIAIVLTVVVLQGCGSLVPSGTTPTSECREADDRYLVWNALCVAAGGAAGATGAGGVLSATLADEPGADIALAASSAGFGIFGTVACTLASAYAERATEACREDQP